jgi:Domain of unknown function (DUF4157)
VQTFAPKQTPLHEPDAGHVLSSGKRVPSHYENGRLSPSSSQNDGEREGPQSGYDRTPLRIGHNFAQMGIFAPQRIQRKLAINKPGDEYEQEADRVAEHVTRTPGPQIQRACACGGSCSKCSGDEESHSASILQRHPSAPGELSEAPPLVSEVLRSPGRPLDRSTSNFMESRFGYDFSHVRVHTDSRAASSARAIDARAYTLGTHVVFAKGQFEPSSSDGRRLLAHELTHVVQQTPARVPPAGADSGGSVASPDLSSRSDSGVASAKPSLVYDFRQPTDSQEAGGGPSVRRAGPPPPFGSSSRQLSVNIGRASQGLVQRDKPDPKPFVGCTPDNTLVDKPVNELAIAVKFAANLVDSALAAIERNDGSANYKVALAKHFRSPSFSDLKDIHKGFRLIFFHLKPENFACASTKEDFDECEKVVNRGFDIAFTPVSSGFAAGSSVLCPVFWFNNLACRALTLIHESAHAVGIGDGGTHPPNRGSADYPALDALQPASQTSVSRKDNPDAYGYFALQIGRETDTDCDKGMPDAPISPRDAIKFEGKAPDPPKKK